MATAPSRTNFLCTPIPGAALDRVSDELRRREVQTGRRVGTIAGKAVEGLQISFEKATNGNMGSVLIGWAASPSTSE